MQARGTPDIDRRYLLRKRQAAADRTTFVCYVCASDCPSSQLRLVYCIANAESEPFYPFIKNKPAPPNASPISPQGMVQICVSCNQQNMHLAEGATPANHSAAVSDRPPFPVSNLSSQSSQREQVPVHIPSTPASALQPGQQHIPSSGAVNPSSAGPAKSLIHDPGNMAVRFKVSETVLRGDHQPYLILNILLSLPRCTSLSLCSHTTH